MTKHHQLSHLSLLGILFGVITLGITLYAITQSTEFRQRADTGAVLYLTSTPEKARSGDKVSISLDVETNAVPIQSVAINLAYPASKLNLEKIDTSSSPFDVPAGDIRGSGYIQLLRDASLPVNGKNHIATLHFIAKEKIDMSEIKPVVGTSILSTTNKNIYTNAVSRGPDTEEAKEPLFSVQFFFKLIQSFFPKI